MRQHCLPVCCYCFRRGKMMRCSVCRSVKYCCKQCQKNDWYENHLLALRIRPFHKLICKKNYQADEVFILLYRILFLLESVSIKSPAWKNSELNLYQKDFLPSHFLMLPENLIRYSSPKAIKIFNDRLLNNVMYFPIYFTL